MEDEEFSLLRVVRTKCEEVFADNQKPIGIRTTSGGHAFQHTFVLSTHSSKL